METNADDAVDYGPEIVLNNEDGAWHVWFGGLFIASFNTLAVQLEDVKRFLLDVWFCNPADMPDRQEIEAAIDDAIAKHQAPST